MRLLRNQSGYMMEVPLLLAVCGVILAVVLPKLPPTAGKLLVGAAAVAVTAGLYYMMLAPGWQPGKKQPGAAGRLAAFGAIAIVIALAAAGYILFY